MKHSTSLLFTGAALLLIASIHAWIVLALNWDVPRLQWWFTEVDFPVPSYWFCLVSGIICLLFGLYKMWREK